MSRLAPSPMPPPGQSRKPSGARPPPGPSSGSSSSSGGGSINPVPVRAEYFASGIPSQPSNHQYQNRHFIPPMVHRPSMPSPKSTLIPPHASTRYTPSTSSRSDGGSGGDSLKESTRHNILASSRERENEVAVRGNLMGARQASANLNWDVKSPKSPEVVTPKERHEGRLKERDEVDVHFDHLLDSLQVPLSVRQKFSTVSPSVKTSILSSTASSNPAILSHLGLPTQSTAGSTPKIKKRLSAPLLRKAKSSSSLGSPGPSPQVGKTYRVDGDSFTIVASPQNQIHSSIIPHPLPLPPNRGYSVDTARPQAVSRLSTGPGRPLSFGLFSSSSSKQTSPTGLGINLSGEKPESLINWLQAYRATDLAMDVGRMKKLRMLLRHENTAWVAEFVKLGGYAQVLRKLKELVDVEWREEQHDDQMLYEVLRCVKAMGTSEVGKAAMRYHYPNPFDSLSTLLFSEKKPGDLPSRQLIIELWLFLFDLFPSPPCASLATSTSRPTSVRFDTSLFAGPPGPTRRPINAADEVRQLLMPDIPDKTVDVHDFVKVAHRPRVFRAWMSELSDICRDYFWIMCHGSNSLWAADEVDERLVEKPVAPGGATGGVEFEAMNYVTVHFKLLNILCKAMADQDRAKAGELHKDLLMSGMDRVLVTLRKASTTFYPNLHLELARYVRNLQLVSPNARLPHLIDKLVGSPPECYRRLVTPPLSSRLDQGRSKRENSEIKMERWIEEARKGGKVGDGGRRGGYDLQV